MAAIVSADVAGYSRLMGRDESGTLAAPKAIRQEEMDIARPVAASSRPQATDCCWSQCRAVRGRGADGKADRT